MSKMLASYDLRKPGRNYQPLYARLDAWGAKRVLESVWILTANASPEEVGNDLLAYMDVSDGLLVVGLDGSAAWSNVQNPNPLAA
ncbi:hypothetical protein [Hyphomicrobium sp.]|uniref:hypothetical protein n=1 Tax=Hyphomicrobium sp. TaxID=82 RepID=UPI002D766006|nr:hypothetical protein [Hyphomicrobium sp.]HET6388102.1 hypothetical protein [Hyphomicrobium sp.]